jgi:hypothetical protein
MRAGKAAGLRCKVHLDRLTTDCEWDKDGSAAAGGIFRQAGEAVASVDQFFDSEEQGTILAE